MRSPLQPVSSSPRFVTVPKIPQAPTPPPPLHPPPATLPFSGIIRLRPVRRCYCAARGVRSFDDGAPLYLKAASAMGN